MGVDLHIHSTASDGTLSPEAIVHEATRLGLLGIAITDHDEVCGSQEAVRIGEIVGLTVVPAVEISTDLGEIEAHILGYWIELKNERLLERLQEIRNARLRRAGRIIERLHAEGVEAISLDDVIREARGGIICRPHVAAALVRAGVCHDAQEAFRRFLSRSAPAYVPRIRPTTVEAIEIIREAGGCPVLAHPGLIPHCHEIIEEMRALGVEGVEAFYPKHTPAQVSEFIARAQAAGLLVTGGSDSHGPGGTEPVAIGSGNAPDSCLEALQQWRCRRRN